MKRILSSTLATLLVCAPALAAKPDATGVIKSIDQRFASDGVEEVPSFRRHVLPLMGRLGCNGRACHGSFQGQGGLRLSLFGYDFDADVEALTKGEKPRVDLKDPEKSLILQKPTMQIDHGGEERFKVGTWQHRVIHKWIASGATDNGKSESDFDYLEVIPREIVFKKPGEKVQLKVIAHWADGAQEDVTTICRFRTNDDATALVDETGVVSILGKGDTHVVAFYDNGVVPVQTMLPVSDLVGKKYPKVPTPTKIDALVVDKLKKLGVVPAELSTDDEFLRRVSLDLTGTPPTPSEIKAFLADPRGDKRVRKIEELINSPSYASWWATKLCDFTGNNDATFAENQNQIRTKQGTQWYEWIERRVRENVAYDDIMEGIVLATSRKPGQSFEDYCEEMTSYYRSENPGDFTARETMPHYWARRNPSQPKDKALSFSYAFLGTRLQCAECHKHPFDQWTKQDFDQFTAFFKDITYNTRNEDKAAYRELEEAMGLGQKANNQEKQKALLETLSAGKLVPWREMYVNAAKATPSRKGDEKNSKGSSRVLTPKLLGGDEVVASEYGDPRKALMEWMRAKDNPYFARAFVNRVWATYFNVGVIEPPDDMNLANPPSNEPLLNYLTEEFVNHDYDMKWLHREIASSRTYQLSWQTNDTNLHDLKNFSHAVVRRLPAEVSYDAIYHATASNEAMAAMHADTKSRYIGVKGNVNYQRGGNVTANGEAYALGLFGKSLRSTNCDCDRTNEPSLLQTMFLQNDSEIVKVLDRNDGWLKQIANAGRSEASRNSSKEAKRLTARLEELEAEARELRKDKKSDGLKELKEKIDSAKRDLARAKGAQEEQDAAPPAALNREELIVEAYLRTVGRLPNDREMKAASEYLSEMEDPIAGMKDLLWALLNTKEFIVNR